MSDNNTTRVSRLPVLYAPACSCARDANPVT